MKEKSLLKGRGRGKGVGRRGKRREKKKKSGGEEEEGERGRKGRGEEEEDEEGEEERDEEGEEEGEDKTAAVIKQPGPYHVFTIPARKKMLSCFAVAETKAQRGKELYSRSPSEEVAKLEIHQTRLIPSPGLPQLPHKPQLIP